MIITLQYANNKGADSAVWMHRLVCVSLLANPKDRFARVEAKLCYPSHKKRCIPVYKLRNAIFDMVHNQACPFSGHRTNCSLSYIDVNKNILIIVVYICSVQWDRRQNDKTTEIIYVLVSMNTD